MLNPRIPPFSVLPNAQTQVSELLQGLGWFGGILSFPFPSCNHMGAAHEDMSGVQALLLVVPQLLLNPPLPRELGC